MSTSRTGNRGQRFRMKREEKSLLATLRSLGRGLSQEEAKEVHRLLMIDNLVDQRAATTISPTSLVYRGKDLLDEEKKLKAQWESFNAYVSAGTDAEQSAKWTDEKVWAVAQDYKVPQGFVRVPPGDRKGLFGQAMAELLVSAEGRGYPPRSRQRKLLGGYIPSDPKGYDEFIRLFRRSKKV